jgi:hypothetical protein
MDARFPKDGPWLILTVGTGTAGRHSNLAEGLRRTISLLEPAAFWLVPSQDEVSGLTAELVAEGMPAFRKWSEEEPFRRIARPDSLEECRAVVREVISRVRALLPKGGRLLVNPTSGTKQMSVGAALAALDEGLGELVFTVGERADGVVRTGTERIESFDPAGYFAERDFETALRLFGSGAHGAAAALMERHPALRGAAEIARCRQEWERQHYPAARRIAAGSEMAELVRCRRALEDLQQAAGRGHPEALPVADLLATAEGLLRLQDWNECLVQACRAFEMGMRLALYQATRLYEPIPLEGLRALPGMPRDIMERASNVSNDGRTTILNLRSIARILQAQGHALGDAFLEDRNLQSMIAVRNERMHGLRAVQENEARLAMRSILDALACLDLPRVSRRPELSAYEPRCGTGGERP